MSEKSHFSRQLGQSDGQGQHGTVGGQRGEHLEQGGSDGHGHDDDKRQKQASTVGAGQKIKRGIRRKGELVVGPKTE